MWWIRWRRSTEDGLLINYAINNPIRFIDPDGRDIFNINGGVRFTEKDAQIAFAAIKRQAESNKPLNVHLVKEKDSPKIYEHKLNAFREGKPQVLHYDTNKKNHAKRRYEATKGIPTVAGLQRDEYPYASTYEGGRMLWSHLFPAMKIVDKEEIYKNCIRICRIKKLSWYYQFQ